MYDGSPETLRSFSVDMVAWGRRPRSDAQIQEFQKETLEWHHEMGIRYLGTVGMVTESRRYIRYCPEWEQTICLTPRGERLHVPWLWDRSSSDNTAYWFCTNDPRYRGYLCAQVALAARGGVDGVHIDDHLGAADTFKHGGCYCDYCMDGFRAYLRENVSAERLREAGVQDLDTFSYRDFVREWMDAAPDRQSTDSPLAGEYRVYQLRATRAMMAELRALAEESAGHPLLFSGNVGVPGPEHLTDYQSLTHFTGEVSHEAERGLDEDNVSAIVAYQLATALNRPLLATGLGEDWAFIKANQRPELVRAWIAEAYAFGQFFMVPHRQWCHTEELGTHWYEGTVEDYGAVYRFIYEHPFLFDGQESAAEVAVVYSTGDEATRVWDGATWEAVRALLKAQVPFDLLVAGDEWGPAQLTWKDAERYRKVIVPANLRLDVEQQRVVDRLRQEGRVVTWSGADALASLPAPPVQTTGPARVWTSLRRGTNGGGTVVHLLNRNYDADADRILTVGPISVSVKRGPCGDKHCTATLYAPGAEPMPLEVGRDGEGIAAKVPLLSLWGVVHLRPEGALPS
jgi:hypothetical protein